LMDNPRIIQRLLKLKKVLSKKRVKWNEKFDAIYSILIYINLFLALIIAEENKWDL
jgi:formate hydrogenlyase subunit 4